jgi:ferredoxin
MSESAHGGSTWTWSARKADARRAIDKGVPAWNEPELDSRLKLRQLRPMTYIVTDPCIKCKFMDCVEVCPVDCFYEGENFLAINPDECIDCGVCEPECPVDAIKPDTEDEPDGRWLEVNSTYSRVWPNITVKGEPPADRTDFERETGKFEKYFSTAPGKGS